MCPPVTQNDDSSIGKAGNFMAWLIIVTGLPAAGKSTLAAWLGKQLSFHFINKDAIKEILFDVLGWSDRPWSQRLGAASVELMYYFAQTLLMAGKSIILENTFRPDLASAKLSALARQANAGTIQIICRANTEMVYQRFKQRAEAGLRHPGHLDKQIMGEGKVSLEDRPLRLDMGGEVIEIDTTDFSALHYESILAQVKAIISA
jgi:predicted kinase